MSEFMHNYEQTIVDGLKKTLILIPRTTINRNKFGDFLHIASGGPRPKEDVDSFISECEQSGLITINTDGSITNNCAAQPDFNEDVMPSHGWGLDQPDLKPEEHMPDDLTRKQN